MPALATQIKTSAPQGKGGATPAASQIALKPETPTVFAVLSAEDIAELQKYTTPEIVLKFPDIMKLLYETPSLALKEKIYWLQLMPLMSEDQVVKLRSILETEKQKLLALNKQYEEDIANISLTPKMTPEEAAKRTKLLRQQEEVHQEKEKGKEEDLLSQL